MMLTFGDKLKHERETRSKTLEEIAGATKLSIAYLEGLERNDFDVLPGPSFGKLYIRAYAEVLGFDPDPLIAEYDRERQRHAQQETGGDTTEEPPAPPRERRRKRAWLEESSSEPPAATPPDPSREAPPAEARSPEPEPEPAPPPAPATPADVPPLEPPRPAAPRPRRALPLAVVVFVGLAVVAWAYTAVFRSDDGNVVDLEHEAPIEVTPLLPADEPSETLIPDEAPPATAEEGPRDPSPATEAVATLPAPLPPPEPAATRASSAGQLTIRDFGLGRRLVGRRVEERTRQFEEGAVAWFSTRVIGGASGQSIRHVWLRKGKPVQSIKLELGGPHWRTHSRKTLWGTGSWAVEARDDGGRILARATFHCVPVGS